MDSIEIYVINLTKNEKKRLVAISGKKGLAAKQANILLMFDSGYNDTEIATKFNLSMPWIRTVRRRFFKKRMVVIDALLNPYRKKSKIAKHDEQIINLFKKGSGSKKIGEKIGFCQRTVIARLNQLGLTTPKIRNKIKINDKELTKLFQSRLSVIKISEKFNSSQSTIYKRLHKLGLLLKGGRTIKLNEKEIEKLEDIANLKGQKSNRAKIILLLHQKHRAVDIAKRLGLQGNYISEVKTCFLEKGMKIF